jgi:hypothetical protein
MRQIDAKLFVVAILALLFSFSLCDLSHAIPKVTQAGMINFTGNPVTAIAVEEFGKPPALFLSNKKGIIYTTHFGEDFSALKEFAYVNSFLRFKPFSIPGLPNPLLIAVAAQPTGTDERYEVKIIFEKDGGFVSLNPQRIMLTTQDGVFLGYINRKYGHGMITWHFQWEAAHYAPHKYEVSVYTWDSRSQTLRLNNTFLTKQVFRDGCTALKHYGFPCRNLRNEVISPQTDISTLGIEDELLMLRPDKNQPLPKP